MLGRSYRSSTWEIQLRICRFSIIVMFESTRNVFKSRKICPIFMTTDTEKKPDSKENVIKKLGIRDVSDPGSDLTAQNRRFQDNTKNSIINWFQNQLAAEVGRRSLRCANLCIHSHKSKWANWNRFLQNENYSAFSKIIFCEAIIIMHQFITTFFFIIRRNA